ncbi:heme exporter protein CcmB [Methylovirgula sp. 4M-Z18]|uniref:heme exporter protein CcmB n=1 Tax=Methylovirgula sp. 4M-Z18 TaxID=2293567 RepID=UPI000E2E4874|nr:heme exporter protein CcmB [Methylovirgula sp. 4M-Z18]RFB78512.1 heme exporter protein CcmB [Methylovirgula sp. 4M-Z18]
MIASLFLRELKLARRVGGGGVMGVIFFLCLVTIVPFGVGPDQKLLGRIGPAILWIAALLASLLGLDRLFQADEEDGSLDLLLMSGVPLELIVAVKCAAHWVVTGLPLVVAAPLFGLLLAIDPPTLAGTTASLLVGTPALTFLGALGAALTVHLRRGGLLLAILILPFSIPTLIFGVSAAAAAGALSPMPFATPFAILCALTLIGAAVGCFAAAIALRALQR